MHQQNQTKTLSQLETLLECFYVDLLPVVELIEIMWLADGLCHASVATDKPFPNTGQFDSVVQHAIAPRRLLRIRTNGGIQNGHGAIYNLPVSCSTHKKPPSNRIAVCVFF